MLPKRHRVRVSAQFDHTLRSGARFGNRNLVVFSAVLPEEDPTTVGFLVSKKVGNAVVRNRTKRRLRELAEELVSSRPTGLSVVVRALPPAAELDFAGLSREYARAQEASLDKLAKRRP